MENAKGAGLLKVVGILMIIGGAIAIVLGIIAVIGVAALIYLELGTPLLYAAGILTLVGAVAELIAGIIGVSNANRPEKAGKCLTWGVIVAVFTVLGSILTVAGGSSFPTFSFLLGLVLPVLFIIGAIKNKQS